MAAFYKTLGIIIIIIVGLYGLILSWYYLYVQWGWDIVLILLVGHFAAAIIPWILAFQGIYMPLLIIYGGGILGGLLYAQSKQSDHMSELTK